MQFRCLGTLRYSSRVHHQTAHGRREGPECKEGHQKAADLRGGSSEISPQAAPTS